MIFLLSIIILLLIIILIFERNPLYSILYFFFITIIIALIILLSLNQPFFSIIILMIYSGALTVLFSFIARIFSFQTLNLTSVYIRFFFFFLLFTIPFLYILFLNINSTAVIYKNTSSINVYEFLFYKPATYPISLDLYFFHTDLLILISFILFISMVGSIYILFRVKSFQKNQTELVQKHKQVEDTIKLVDVKPNLGNSMCTKKK